MKWECFNVSFMIYLKNEWEKFKQFQTNCKIERDKDTTNTLARFALMHRIVFSSKSKAFHSLLGKGNFFLKEKHSQCRNKIHDMIGMWRLKCQVQCLNFETHHGSLATEGACEKKTKEKRRKARAIFIRSHCRMKNIDLFWTIFDWYSSHCWLCQQWNLSHSLSSSPFPANATPYLFLHRKLHISRLIFHRFSFAVSSTLFLPCGTASSRSTQKNRRWNAIYLPFRNMLLDLVQFI